MTGRRHVTLVRDEPTTAALTYDEANARFKETWNAARTAYADAQSALGALANPLFRPDGGVSLVRVDAAAYQAERAAAALRDLTASITAARELYTTTEPTPTVTYRRRK